MNWRATLSSSMQRAAKPQSLQIAVTLLFVMLVLAAFTISFLGYVLQLKWTGVTDKTFWHWLGLLFAPVLLSGGGFLLYTAWAWSDHRLAEKAAHEAARHADLDRITKGYLDDIEQLLLKVDSKQQKEDIVCAIARARTLNVLEGLDRYRKGSIIRFLYAAHLICTQPQSGEQEPSQQLFILLNEANLRTARLRRAYLRDANLSGADLSYADLRDANLRDANLSEADVGGADLRHADLSGAKVSRAKLSGADLSDATGWTEGQLAAAFSLEGATMPDGQVLKSDDNPDGLTLGEWLKSKGSGEDGENGGPS